MSGHQDQEQGRSSRWNVLLVYLVAGFTTAGHGAAQFTVPLNLNHLGFPLPLVGLVMSSLGFGALLSRVPGGALYRLSRARLLGAGALTMMSVTGMALAFADQFGPVALLTTLHGFSFGLSTTVLLAVLIEVRPRGENPAPTMAWYTAAVSTGYAAAGPIGAQAIELFGYGSAFIVAGLIGLIAASLMLLLRLKPDETRGAAQEQQTGATFPGGFRAIASQPAGVWLAMLLVFYINFVSDTYHAFFPIHALNIGISVAVIGFFSSIHAAAATGIRFAALVLFRFVSAGVVNHLSVVAMSLGTIALSMVTDEVVLAAIFVVLGASRGLIRVTSATMIAEERKRPGVNIGMASALYNAGLDLGSMLGPPVAGALANMFDIPTTMRLVAVALPAAYYAIWFTQRARSARRSSADRAVAP